MANQEHIELLLDGVDPWNKKRQEDSDFVPDLTDAKLYNTRLVGANLAGVNLSKAYIFEPEQERKEQYDSCAIKSISSLLTECKKLRQLYHDRDYVFYYRGESESCWELRPAVMRASHCTLPYREYEAEMLVDLMSRWPEAFDNENSAIGYWVLAQHHGLKTRLLDVTRNPNVALYNACTQHGGKQCNGVLHVFAVPRELIKPYSSDTISLVSNFARLSHKDREVLLGRIGGQDGLVEYNRSLSRLYHLIRQEKPYFEQLIDPVDLFRVFVVEPQQRFNRIRAQSGAFIISAFHERLERNVIRKRTRDVPTYFHYPIEVTHARKKDILAELGMVNITRETGCIPSVW